MSGFEKVLTQLWPADDRTPARAVVLLRTRGVLDRRRRTSDRRATPRSGRPPRRRLGNAYGLTHIDDPDPRNADGRGNPGQPALHRPTGMEPAPHRPPVDRPRRQADRRPQRHPVTFWSSPVGDSAPMAPRPGPAQEHLHPAGRRDRLRRHPPPLPDPRPTGRSSPLMGLSVSEGQHKPNPNHVRPCRRRSHRGSRRSACPPAANCWS